MVVGVSGPRTGDISGKQVVAHYTCMQGDGGNHSGSSNVGNGRVYECRWSY